MVHSLLKEKNDLGKDAELNSENKFKKLCK